MLDQILTPDVEIYEFDLTELGLPDHNLWIDEEGIYILNNEFRFFVTGSFLQDGYILEEESNSCPPIIFNDEQRSSIIKCIKEIAGLHSQDTNYSWTPNN